MIPVGFITAVIIGFVSGFVPGAVVTMIFSEVLRHGFFAGLRVLLWSMLVEIIVASAIIFGFSQASLPEAVFYGIGFFGAGFLIYLAWGVAGTAAPHAEKAPKISAWKILLLNLTNAPLYIFWSSVAPSEIHLLAKDVSHAPAWFLFFMESGWLLGTTAVVCLLAFARSFLMQYAHLVFRVLAGVLVLMAARLVWNSVIFFF